MIHKGVSLIFQWISETADWSMWSNVLAVNIYGYEDSTSVNQETDQKAEEKVSLGLNQKSWLCHEHQIVLWAWRLSVLSELEELRLCPIKVQLGWSPWSFSRCLYHNVRGTYSRHVFVHSVKKGLMAFAEAKLTTSHFVWRGSIKDTKKPSRFNVFWLSNFLYMRRHKEK